MHKTQVFLSHEGDLFRTRLTHSIEVAQIARVISRRLNLNEDLTEALCLAHDLGHTPFGHAGQHALNRCLRKLDSKSCGFEHNIQSLRIVDKLECKYFNFDGLNLCFETREGILKHCSKLAAKKLGDVAERFLCGGFPTLEAQLVNIADEIAYNHHDLDDGLRSGLLDFEEVVELEAVKSNFLKVERAYPYESTSFEAGEYQSRRQSEVIRRMINVQIEDLVTNTKKKIVESAVSTVDEVRNYEKLLVGFSDEMQNFVKELKFFLHEKLYKHTVVIGMTSAAEIIIADFFKVLLDKSVEHNGEPCLRSTADSIAAMTDRTAALTHLRYFPNKVIWPREVYFT